MTLLRQQVRVLSSELNAARAEAAAAATQTSSLQTQVQTLTLARDSAEQYCVQLQVRVSYPDP